MQIKSLKSMAWFLGSSINMLGSSPNLSALATCTRHTKTATCEINFKFIFSLFSLSVIVTKHLDHGVKKLLPHKLHISQRLDWKKEKEIITWPRVHKVKQTDGLRLEESWL